MAKKKSGKKSTELSSKLGEPVKKKNVKKTATKSTSNAKSDLCGEHLSSAKPGKSYLVGQTFGLKPVEYVAIGDHAMFEGDIILGSVAEMEFIRKSVENPDPNMANSVAITGSQFRWPDGVIAYRIDNSLPNQARVTSAIAHIEANTNLRFRVRNSETNFVTFRPAAGCSSSVGMRGNEQFVNLGTECSQGNAIHEICHTAGLWHEQSREDRDHFVRINATNILPVAIHNFDQQITDGDDIGPYDYGSIMHYPRNAFAINPSLDTITPIPNAGTPIGQRTGLSAGDIAAINFLYPRKATLTDTSSNGAVVTNRDNRVLMSWTGSGNLQLNFQSTTDGLSFGQKVTLADASPDAPALAVFNNRYYVAWMGVGNNRLNVMSSADGLNWGNKITLNESTLSTPGLAAFGNRLVLAWRGVGNNQINVLTSTNGTAFANKVTLSETTTAGVALTTLGTNLLVAWRGVGNNQLNILKSSNAATFTGKVTLSETSNSTPCLFSTSNRTILTWQGIGNLFLNAITSTDGTHWGSKLTSKETCIDGPSMTSLKNRLLWAWTGTDAQHHLNSMLISLP